MGIINDIAYKVGQVAGESKRKKDSIERVNQQGEKENTRISNMQNVAQNGNVNAMFDLGCCYLNGTYVALDTEKACHWWTQAAERGHVSAQYNLGLLYLGEISASYYNENLAGFWVNAAAKNGDQEAVEWLKEFYYSKRKQKWYKR